MGFAEGSADGTPQVGLAVGAPQVGLADGAGVGHRDGFAVGAPQVGLDDGAWVGHRGFAVGTPQVGELVGLEMQLMPSVVYHGSLQGWHCLLPRSGATVFFSHGRHCNDAFPLL